MKIFCDTSIFVAHAIASHEHHARAATIMTQVKAKKHRGFIAAHTAIETYAVLSRLPLVPRFLPEEARRVVIENVFAYFTATTLDANEHRELVEDLGRRGVIGGAAYDGLILRCAQKAKVERIYTFNVKHFRALAPHLEDKICAP